jgi:hypothetical protein
VQRVSGYFSIADRVEILVLLLMCVFFFFFFCVLSARYDTQVAFITDFRSKRLSFNSNFMDIAVTFTLR